MSGIKRIGAIAEHQIAHWADEALLLALLRQVVSMLLWRLAQCLKFLFF